MSKTVVVFTTRYIDSKENDLFFGERYDCVKVTSSKYSPLATFWGKYIHEKYINTDDPEVMQEYLSLIGRDIEPIADLDTFEQILDIFKSIRKDEFAKIAELCCNHWPRELNHRERCMSVYQLKKNNSEKLNEDIDVFAVWHLKEGMNRIEEWKEALINCFKSDEDTVLYLIMHGSTDLNMIGPFGVLDSAENNLKIAYFHHEISDDKIAQLLSSSLDAKEVVYKVKKEFQEKTSYNLAKEISKLLMSDIKSQEINSKYEKLYALASEMILKSVDDFKSSSVFEKSKIIRDFIISVND